MPVRRPLCLVDGRLKELPAGDTLPGAGGAATITATTITIGYEASEAEAVVTDATVSGTSKIIVGWGNVLDTDENGPDFDNVTFRAIPGAGQFTVKVASQGDDIGGAFKIYYITG